MKIKVVIWKKDRMINLSTGYVSWDAFILSLQGAVPYLHEESPIVRIMGWETDLEVTVESAESSID